MSIFRKSGMVNVKMVITEEKILSNIDKIQKLINPNSKKQIVKLDEDSYFKDLVESVKTYLLEYPKKKNFPKNVYKAAYELVEYATSEFEENTKRIEKLIRKREKNIKLGQVLKDVAEAVKAHAKNWKEIVEKLSKKYPADVAEALYIIGNSKDKTSEEYIDAEKLIQAKIKNLEQNFHIEIDMERIDDRSKALSYIGIEIAEALKYIPAPAEEFISDNEVEKVVPIQDIKVTTQDSTAESVAAKIETEVMVQPKPRVAVQVVEQENEVHDEEQEANTQYSETISETNELVQTNDHEESNTANSIEKEQTETVAKRNVNISGAVGRIDELTSIKTEPKQEQEQEVQETAVQQEQLVENVTPVKDEQPLQPVPITVQAAQVQQVQTPVQQVQTQPVQQMQAQVATPQVVVRPQQVAQTVVQRPQQQAQAAQPVQRVAQPVQNVRPAYNAQQMMNGYNMYQQQNMQAQQQARMQYYGQYNPQYMQQFAANNQYSQPRNMNPMYQNAYQQQNQVQNYNNMNQGYNNATINVAEKRTEQSGKGKRFNKKPSLWQRIKNSKIGKKIGYLFRIRLVVQYPELPEGRDNQ